MIVLVESFVSPFIRTSDFPFRFKVRDEYSRKNQNLILLRFDSKFFRKIAESKYVKRFTRSKEYKDAEKIFNLSEAKNELEKIFDTVHSYYSPVTVHPYYSPVNCPLADIDFSHYFPFDSKRSNTEDLDIKMFLQIKKENFLFRMWFKKTEKTSPILEEFYVPILGNFQSSEFYITKQSLKMITLDNVTKVGLPHVYKDYIYNLLSSYEDLKYKFIAISKINYKFDKLALKEFLNRFVDQFTNGVQVYDYRFFIQPTQSAFIPKRSIIYHVDDDILIRLGSGVDDYIMIYSNEYPLKNKIIRKFKDASEYFADCWAILEIKRK
jgi:hypothetical protein